MDPKNHSSHFSDTQKAEIKARFTAHFQASLKDEIPALIKEALSETQLTVKLQGPAPSEKKEGTSFYKWAELILKIITAILAIAAFWFGVQKFVANQESQERKELVDAVYKIKNKEFEMAFSRVQAGIHALSGNSGDIQRMEELLYDFYRDSLHVTTNPNDQAIEDANRVANAFDFLIVLQKHHPQASDIVKDAVLPDMKQYHERLCALDTTIRYRMFIGKAFWKRLDDMCDKTCRQE